MSAWPEKSRGLLHPRAGLSEKSALTEAEKMNFPINWMCARLGVAPFIVLRLACPARASS